MGKLQPTGYWTFFCNPAKWEIDKFLASGANTGGFLVTDWQADWFEPGQRGVMRVGTDQRSQEARRGRPRLRPGVYAIVDVTSEARPWTDGDRHWLVKPPGKGARQRVDIRYGINLLQNPLLISDLRGLPGVNDPYLLNGFQASTMPLEPATFRQVMALLGRR